MLVFQLKHMAVVMLSLVAAFSACKKRKESTAKATSRGESCARVLTEPEETQLVTEASKLAKRALLGEMSLDQRNREADELIRSFGSTAERSAEAKAVLASTHDFLASAWLLPIALNWSPTSKLSEQQLKTLESVGVARELAEGYVAEIAAWYAPLYSVVREHGFKYDEQVGWSFTEQQIHVDAFKKSPSLAGAAVMMFGSKVTAELLNPERSEALFFDSIVFQPPQRQGEISVWEKTRWTRSVQQSLKFIADATESFIKSSKEASTYSNLMKGRIVEWFGGERGLNGKTAPEIEVQASYKILNRSIHQLVVEFGVGPELRQQLLAMQQKLIHIESAHLDEGLATLDKVQRAAIAAPFIPAIIWATPFVAGSVSPAMVPFLAKMSSFGAVASFGFAAGSAVISASTKATGPGGGFFCHLANDFASKGADALFMAPFAAALPAVGVVTAGTIATASGGSICVGTAYGALNVGLAAFSVKFLIEEGSAGLSACYDALKLADEAGKAGDQKTAEVYTAKGIQSCATAGLELTFAMVQGGLLSKGAVASIKQKNLKPLLGQNCFGLGLDCGVVPHKQRPIATQAELSAVAQNSQRLHQNISHGERFDVVRNVPLKMTVGAPGHDHLRSPQSVVEMGKAMASSSDKGLAMFRGKDKIILNVSTNSKAEITAIEVADGNHRFAAGMYADILSPGKGWKKIGDIPEEFLEIRVNGFNTQGQKLPRWVPLHTVKEGNFPQGSWREIPPEWGAKGPTAEISGEIASTSSLFNERHRGVSLLQVLETSLHRIGIVFAQ